MRGKQQGREQTNRQGHRFAGRRGSTSVALLLAAALLATNHPLWADVFSLVMSQRLQRHAAKEYPDLIPLDQVLSAPGAISFQHPAVSAWQPVLQEVQSFASPLQASAQLGVAGTTIAAVRGQQTWSDLRITAAFRHEQQHAYDSAEGESIRTGLRRQSEYLQLQRGGADSPSLNLLAIVDTFSDGKVPHYSLDAIHLQRQLFSATATSLPVEGFFERLDLKGTWYQLRLEADNESLRQPIAQRIAAEADADSWQATVRLWRRGGGWLTVESSRDRYDSNRYSHEYGPDRISSIRMPDAQAIKGAMELGSRWQDGFGKLEAAVRLDLQWSDPGRADQRPTIPGVAGAFYNSTPREMYRRYYGSTDLHNEWLEAGARLRLETPADPRQGWHLDLKRVVRMPELMELYMANTGSGDLVQVGNPQLEAEKHHRLELGSRLTAPGYRRYGRDGGMGAGELRLTLFGDWVDDFIVIERAKGQAGILMNNDGLVQRNIQAELVGLQAELAANLLPGWSARLHLLAQSGSNRSDQRTLYQIPPVEANLFLDHYSSEQPWNAGLRWRLVDGRSAVDTLNHGSRGPDWGGEFAGFASLDLYGGYRFGERVALSGGVVNLFNHSYRDPLAEPPQTPITSYLPAPGRTLYLQLNGAF